MTKIYICIGIFLVITWLFVWFLVKSMFRSLDHGEDSKLAKLFLPKDYMRNLEMIERQAQRERRIAERKAAEHQKETSEEISDEE